MDATDRLCRMLDELGIEWWHDDDISPGHTEWMTDDAAYTSLGMDGDMLSVKAISKMTPEQAIAATVGVDLNTGEAIRKLLDKLNTELCNAGCVVECETREERQRLIDAVKDKYAQAIVAMVGKRDTMGLWPEWEQVLFANVSDEVAQDNLNECVHDLLDKAATVGDKPKDNPRNYNSDGTPKIPNMHIGADPDWVDWVARLNHEEPLSLKEAVEQLMFETICFGGDMGPNDCGGEHCPDEGMVYTNDFINSWVNKIAATVGAGTLTAEQVRECSKGVYFEGYSDGAAHRVNGIEETDWQAIADKLNATVGAGTCHMRLTYEEEDADGCIWPDHYECDACGAKVNGIMPFYDTEIPPRFCPNCGKKVVSE